MQDNLFQLRQPSLYTFGEMQVYDKFPAAFERLEITKCQSHLQLSERIACTGDLDILLRGLGARTLLMVGGFTDVCVHYAFADAHQRDYVCRVVEDCVAGSSLAAHEASLNAMEYLQTGARRSSAEMIAAFGTKMKVAAE